MFVLKNKDGMLLQRLVNKQGVVVTVTCCYPCDARQFTTREEAEDFINLDRFINVPLRRFTIEEAS